MTRNSPPRGNTSAWGELTSNTQASVLETGERAETHMEVNAAMASLQTVATTRALAELLQELLGLLSCQTGRGGVAHLKALVHGLDTSGACEITDSSSWRAKGVRT